MVQSMVSDVLLNKIEIMTGSSPKQSRCFWNTLS